MNDITNINSNRAQLNSNQSSSVSSRNEAKQSNQSSSPSSVSKSDRVTITNTASRLKDIENELHNASSIDDARVAEMKSAISNGDYTVDADRIADKMLDFENFMS